MSSALIFDRCVKLCFFVVWPTEVRRGNTTGLDFMLEDAS